MSYRDALYVWSYYALLLLLTVLVAFVTPTNAAVLYYSSRIKGFLEGKAPDPTPTAWDWHFTGKELAASVGAKTGKLVPCCENANG